MEMIVGREVNLIRSLRWWTPERYFTEAHNWWLDNEGSARRVPVGQWENFGLCGAGLENYGEYEEALRAFFWGEKAIAGSGPDRRRTRGAVYRDASQRRWGQPGLAQSLVDAVSKAAEQESSPIEAEWRLLLKAITDKQAVEELASWRAYSQAREFVNALVLIARANVKSEKAGKQR